MNIRNYIIISVMCVVCSIVLFMIKNHYIIFYFNHSVYADDMIHQIQKKDVILHYYQNDAWKHEKQTLLWSDSKQDNIYHLINAWLTLMNEENIMEKKVIVQSVLLTDSESDAYVSFDYNPLFQEDAAFNSLMLLEGLLKTVRENNIIVNYMQFLEHHVPLHDTILDFSKPWPVTGFLSS